MAGRGRNAQVDQAARRAQVYTTIGLMLILLSFCAGQLGFSDWTNGNNPLRAADNDKHGSDAAVDPLYQEAGFTESTDSEFSGLRGTDNSLFFSNNGRKRAQSSTGARGPKTKVRKGDVPNYVEDELADSRRLLDEIGSDKDVLDDCRGPSRNDCHDRDLRIEVASRDDDGIFKDIKDIFDDREPDLDLDRDDDDDNSGSGSGDDDDDHSGPGGGDDIDDHDDDSNSGPGGGDDIDDDSNSGPGGGDDHDDSDDDDDVSSGSNSGSGSGSDDDDRSGSNSGPG